MARPVSDTLHDVVDAILSVEVDMVARRRMALAGALGGCGLRQEALGAYADAALYAACNTKVDKAHILAAALGRPAAWCCGAGGADLARAGLLEHGVAVDNAGGVCLAADAAKMYVATPWHGDQPVDEVGRLAVEPSPILLAPSLAPWRWPAQGPAPLRFQDLQALGRRRSGAAVACGRRPAP